MNELEATELVPWLLAAAVWLAGLGVLGWALVRTRRAALAVAAVAHLVGPAATFGLAYASVAAYMARFGAESTAPSMLGQLGWSALAAIATLVLVEVLAVSGRREGD